MTMSRIGVLLSAIVANSSARAGDAPAPGWDAPAAARYLDGRAREWFAFKGADRGEGADAISCASCHTLVPYALARASLRNPSAEFADKIRAQTGLRAAHQADLDTPKFALFYDFDDAKKVQSRGTEAVMNALLLALDDRARDRKSPADATRMALDHLWASQAREGADAGSWDWLNFGLAPWEATPGRYFGASLAAIATGTAPGYLTGDAGKAASPRVDALRAYLRSRYASQDLHNRVWALWASTAIGGVISPEARDKLIAEVVAKQQPGGGWNLASLGDYKRGDGTPQVTAADGYATGLILHTFQLAGLPPDHPAVSRGLSWLRSNQQPTGAWLGHSLNKNRKPETHVGKFMTDAATSMSVLALSHEATPPGPARKP